MSMDRNAGNAMIGVDGSSAADAAALWAADETAPGPRKQPGIAVRLPDPHRGSPGIRVPARVRRCHSSCRQSRVGPGCVRGDGAIPRSAAPKRMTESDARLALVKQSAQARLTVVGSRGKGRLAEVLLGSVAFHVHGPRPFTRRCGAGSRAPHRWANPGRRRRLESV